MHTKYVLWKTIVSITTFIARHRRQWSKVQGDMTARLGCIHVRDAKEDRRERIKLISTTEGICSWFGWGFSCWITQNHKSMGTPAAYIHKQTDTQLAIQFILSSSPADAEHDKGPTAARATKQASYLLWIFARFLISFPTAHLVIVVATSFCSSWTEGDKKFKTTEELLAGCSVARARKRQRRRGMEIRERVALACSFAWLRRASE